MDRASLTILINGVISESRGLVKKCRMLASLSTTDADLFHFLSRQISIHLSLLRS